MYKDFFGFGNKIIHFERISLCKINVYVKFGFLTFAKFDLYELANFTTDDRFSIFLSEVTLLLPALLYISIHLIFINLNAQILVTCYLEYRDGWHCNCKA